MNQAAPAAKTTQPGLAPLLNVRGGRRALEFYLAAFGAEELFCLADDHGQIVARLAVGGAEFWLADEAPDHANFSPESLGGSSVRLVLTVADPDALFQRAIRAGAVEVWPVADQHGWRLGRLRDPFGHHWEIGKPLSPPL